MGTRGGEEGDRVGGDGGFSCGRERGSHRERNFARRGGGTRGGWADMCPASFEALRPRSFHLQRQHAAEESRLCRDGEEGSARRLSGCRGDTALTQQCVGRGGTRAM